MQVKLGLQPTLFELQVIVKALGVYVQHLEDGEAVPIVGNSPVWCLTAAKTLMDEIGMRRESEPGEYPTQPAFVQMRHFNNLAPRNLEESSDATPTQDSDPF